MNKICTTIEQSKKLIELGVDVNTVDMIHNILGESYVRQKLLTILENNKK